MDTVYCKASAGGRGARTNAVISQAYPTLWTLVALSLGNAFYTISRMRNYRLFEANIERIPETPSARRVKVQSEPTASSPLRFLSSIMPTETAESRAHADKKNDVWELSVWDPLPACLRLFCLFSPGHVLVYTLFLPVAPLDQRPSVTVFNCLVLQAILSTQLLLLQSRFSQQVKDTSIIHREVLHEYDTKFVHPRLHPVVRDAGTQVDSGADVVTLDAETGTPTTQISRSFQTHPNPNYARHVNVNAEGARGNVLDPRLFSPAPQASKPKTFRAMQQEMRTPAQRQSLPAPRVTHSPAPAPTPSSPAPAPAPTPKSSGTTTGTNFGGSMGIYTHARSPLKKAASLGEMKAEATRSPRNSREMAALEQRRWEEARLATPAVGTAGASPARGLSSSTSRHGRGFGPTRYPSRWQFDGGEEFGRVGRRG